LKTESQYLDLLSLLYTGISGVD